MAGPNGTFESYSAAQPTPTPAPSFESIGQGTYTPAPANSSAGDAGAALLGGLFGLWRDKQNSKYAEEAATKQYERQLEFWHKQNQYNTPAEQRKRLEAAGINPAAAMSGGVENQSQGLSQVPGNEYAKSGVLRTNGAEISSIATMMLDQRMKRAQIRDLEATAKLKDSQAAESGQRSDSIRIDNAIKTAMDDVEFVIPGLGTYKGARLVKAVGDAKNIILQSFSDEIGYRSLKNEFDEREFYDYWAKKVGYESNILYDDVFAQLKRYTELDLTRSQIDLIAKQITDLGSQILYRALSVYQVDQRIQLDKDKFNAEMIQRYSEYLVDWFLSRETRRHNLATEHVGRGQVMSSFFGSGVGLSGVIATLLK